MNFENAKFLKLRQVDNDCFAKFIDPMLAECEQILGTFQTVRDGVVFTNLRVIAINIQGVGMRKEFTSLPYKQVQAFAVETAGVFDIDAELQIWLCGLGKLTFEFSSGSNIAAICRMISERAL